MRHCPHCGLELEVYRTDGCSSVYCGRDASDKGNALHSNLGCGEQFNWHTARHYKAKVTAFETRITDLDASDLDDAEAIPAAAAPVPTVPDGACVRAPATIIK